MLGAAQADALGAEDPALAGVALGVGVGANLHVAGRDPVGPLEQRLQLGRCFRPRGVEDAEIDVAGTAVDRDLVALVERAPTDVHAILVDFHQAGTDHGGDAPPPGDDRGVADHAYPTATVSGHSGR